MEKKELIGLSKEELTAELVNIGEKSIPGQAVVAMDLFSRRNRF